MLSEGVIEVNYLILIIALIAILSGLLIILHFSWQKYENQLQSLQDEALLKLRALNEKIEFNHSSKTFSLSFWASSKIASARFIL